MSSFARLDTHNKVVEIVKVNNSIPNPKGFLNTNGVTFIQTYYNGSNYAAIGDTWYEVLNAFISPQPYPSWYIVGTEWQPPVPLTDGKNSEWNEEELKWQIMQK